MPNIGQWVGDKLGFDPTPNFNLARNSSGSVLAPGYAAETGTRIPRGQAGVLGASTTGGSSTVRPTATPSAPPMPPSPYGGDGAGGAGGTDYSLDLAALDAQERQLRDFISGSGVEFNQGMTGIQDNYNKLTGKAKEQYGRVTQDLGVKEQDTTMAKENALGRVDTDARTLANSLRQRIGRASGSGSSAYQITAPGAVQREASMDRDNVQDTFGANFRDLDITKKRSEEDYGNLLRDYEDTRRDSTSKFRSAFEGQLQEAEGQLGDIAANRTAMRGGGVGAINAARQPYDARVADRKNTIRSLFDQYRNPYQARDLNTATPTLRDYTTDRAAVTAGQPAGQAGASPYARFLPQAQEDEEKAIF